jgi:uncharacterized membrane protein
VSDLGDNEIHIRVTEGIRSLHERLDELELTVVARLNAESQPLTEPDGKELPAWQRVTEGEGRWAAAVITAAGIALQVAVPGHLSLISPSWILPTVQGLLLVTLVAINPTKINRESVLLRWLALTLAGVMSVANVWSVVHLIIALINGGADVNKPATLLFTGASIWLTNVIAFALWYWEFDRGGPVERARGIVQYPDLQFPQMTAPDMAPPHWEPAFADYLYVAFTNATAFSPTDTMPMSRWAKLAMTLQSAISLITIGLIVARAVNILQ